MPKPTTKHMASFTKERGRYRLGCTNCDREDFDGVKSLPKDWQDIGRIQSLKESMTTYETLRDGEPPKGYSAMDWWTHLGLCPDCV